MQRIEKDNIIFIRLFQDENIEKQIKKVCKEHQIQTAVVLSGIGQIKNFKIGYFKEKGEYTQEKIKKPHELLSLEGNICKDNDEYILHFHIVAGDENKKTIGGHFITGEVNITNEIVLLKTKLDLKRKTEAKTGLKDLIIE